MMASVFQYRSQLLRNVHQIIRHIGKAILRDGSDIAGSIRVTCAMREMQTEGSEAFSSSFRSAPKDARSN